MTDYAPIPLEQLIRLVTAVRDGIVADYTINGTCAIENVSRMEIPQQRGERWVMPLMRLEAGGPVAEKPVAALDFWHHGGHPGNPCYEGCDGASLELLWRMPENADELSLAGGAMRVKPLASISVSKSIERETRYTRISYLAGGDSFERFNLIHHGVQMPIALDMVGRFLKEVQSLSPKINWTEDIRRRAA